MLVLASSFVVAHRAVYAYIALVSIVCMTSGCSERRRHAELPAPGGVNVKIYVEEHWEVSQPLSYEVYSGDRIVIPITCFYARNPDMPVPAFRLVSTGTLVGVVADDSPTKLLIMYDAASSESWPYCKDDEHVSQSKVKRNKLLAGFNERSPVHTFTAGE